MLIQPKSSLLKVVWGAVGVALSLKLAYSFSYNKGYKQAEAEALQNQHKALIREVEAIKDGIDELRRVSASLDPVKQNLVSSLNEQHKIHPSAGLSMSTGSLQSINEAIRQSNRVVDELPRLPTYK